MFGVFKKKPEPEPKSTYHKQKSECGSELFRVVSPLGIETWDDGTKNLWIHDFEILFECIKCGRLYNRYGSKEGE